MMTRIMVTMMIGLAALAGVWLSDAQPADAQNNSCVVTPITVNGDNAARITWNSDGGERLVYRNGVFLASDSVSPFVDSDMLVGNAIHYSIRTPAQSNRAYCGSAPNPGVLATPGWCTVSKNAQGLPQLSWGSVADAASYNLWRNGARIFSGITQPATSDALPHLPGTYHYSVEAASGNTTSPTRRYCGSVTNAAGNFPSPSCSVSYDPTTLKLTVSWNDVGAPRYRVYRQGAGHDLVTYAEPSLSVRYQAVRGTEHFSIASVQNLHGSFADQSPRRYCGSVTGPTQKPTVPAPTSCSVTRVDYPTGETLDILRWQGPAHNHEVWLDGESVASGAGLIRVISTTRSENPNPTYELSSWVSGASPSGRIACSFTDRSAGGVPRSSVPCYLVLDQGVNQLLVSIGGSHNGAASYKIWRNGQVIATKPGAEAGQTFFLQTNAIVGTAHYSVSPVYPDGTEGPRNYCGKFDF